MEIVLAILFFIFGSISAAMKGDYSGINFIGKALMYIGILLIFACIFSGFSIEGSGKVLLISVIMLIFGSFLAVKE